MAREEIITNVAGSVSGSAPSSVDVAPWWNICNKSKTRYPRGTPLPFTFWGLLMKTE